MGAEKPKTILLVEDEAITAMAEKMALEKYGYKVIIADSGEEAVETVAKTPAIDLILMDINLGTGIDGTEAAAIILRQRDLPVVFLSSHTEPEIVAKTEKITSYGYVVKDSSGTVLDASIKMAFKLYAAKIKELEKEEALQVSLERFEFANRATFNAIWDWDLRTDAIWWNENFQTLFGYRAEEIEPDIASWKNRIHPEDLDRVKTSIHAAIDSGKQSWSDHYRFRRKDGSYADVDDRGYISRDQGGQPVRMIGAMQDVSERKQAESQREAALKALRESEEKYRILIENSHDIIFTLSTDGVFTFVSPSWTTLLGHSLDQVTGKPFQQFVHPDDLAGCMAMLQKVIATGQRQDRAEAYRVRHADGSWRWHVTNAVPIKDAAGIVVGGEGIARDITERKRGEYERAAALGALRESERAKSELLEKLNAAQHLAMIGSWDWDLQSDRVWWSEETYRIFGVTPEDFIPSFEANGKFIHPEDFASYGKSFEHAFQTGEPLDVELRLIAGDGVLKHCDAKGKIIYDDSGQAIRFIGTIMDITERKRTESQREAALEKLRSFALAVESSSDAIGMSTPDGKHYYQNKAFDDLFGDIGENPPATVYVDEQVGREVFRTIMGGNPWAGEIKMKGKAGELLDVFQRAYAIKDSAGRILGLVGIHTNITERKWAESQKEAALEKLHESEARYRTLVENASDLVYRTDTAGRFTFVNRATFTISGYEEKELIGKYYPSLIQPDMRNKAVRIFLHQIKEGTHNTYSEFPVITKGGRQLWLGQNIQLVLENGRVTGFQAVSRDITERKRIETALSESEDLYRDLVENSLDLICTHDLEGKVLSINQAAVRLTGYPHGDLLTMNMADLLMPEVRHLFKAYLAEIQAKGWAHGTMRVQTASGEPRYWEFHNTLRTKDVAIPVVRGVGRDITERERAEKEIKRQLAEKEILLKEVHHRIKNNIASIGGLISLHMQSVSNPEAVAVLQEAIGRVDSMRILYDKLLITEDYRDISVKNYAESLADAVLALFPDRAKVKLEKQIDDFYLDPKQLFPLGLIINELITNKMKYAFIDREAGRITISLKNVAKHVTLDIRDNGNKLPAGFDMDKTKGFGLMLVKMLTKQLGGSFSMEKKAGTRCTVEFDI
jgi:PAS domain S-box-containing protein